MSKNSLFFSFVLSTVFAASCSKQTPLVVKNEVAPKPEVYTSAMAISDITLINEFNASEVVSKIAMNISNDNDWAIFWNDLYIKYNSLSWNNEILSQVVDLSAISCGSKASQAFSDFSQKVLVKLDDRGREEILIRALKHFKSCSIQINKTLVREFLNLYKNIDNKTKTHEFAKVYSLVMDRPSLEEVSDISELIDSLKDMNQRLDLYYNLRNNHHYKGVVDKIIDSFDYEEIVDLTESGRIELDDSLEILNISRHNQLNLNGESVTKLLKTINEGYVRQSSKLAKYNLSKFHYDTLRNLNLFSLNEIENWAEFALSNYKDIGNMYPKDSAANLFLNAMSGKSLESNHYNADENVDSLLVARAKIQTNRSAAENLAQYENLCKMYEKFGTKTSQLNQISDLNKVGCKNYLKSETLEISQLIKMPIFSALNTQGVDVKVQVKPIRLSVINTSQTYKFEKLKNVQTEDKYNHMVVPLVYAFSPLKDVGRFKTGQKHYVALHHVYRDARELIPGLEGVTRPMDGKKAGDIIFTKESYSSLKHIGLGGEGQLASEAKIGAHEYKNSLDQTNIRSWVESFSGNSSFYFSDNFKNTRNIKNLIEASISEQNIINLYIDPDYLSALTQEQISKLHSDLEKIKKLEGMGEVSDAIVLEILAKRSAREMIDSIENLSFSANLEEIIPSFFTSLNLESGPAGLKYENGKRGQNGQIITE